MFSPCGSGVESGLSAIYTFHSVCLPHRCLLPSRESVFMCNLSGMFPFNEETTIGTLLLCWCAASCSDHNPGSTVQTSMQPLGGGFLFPELGAVQKGANRDLRPCVQTRSLTPVPDASRAPRISCISFPLDLDVSLPTGVRFLWWTQPPEVLGHLRWLSSLAVYLSVPGSVFSDALNIVTAVVTFGHCRQESCANASQTRIMASWIASRYQDSICTLLNWKCGLPATRVGEASHSGPAVNADDSSQLMDIMGAALQEAHQPGSQMSCDQVCYTSDSASHAPLVGLASSPLPPPRSVTSSVRRPAPPDSSQAPCSKRLASSHGRWYCPVTSCPDHCPLSSRGWASFSAMKGHCDRHLGGFLAGDLPLDWLHKVGYEFAGSASASCPLDSAGAAPRVGLLSLSPIHNPARDARFLMISLLWIRCCSLGFPCGHQFPWEHGTSGVVASMQPSRESSPIGTLELGWTF